MNDENAFTVNSVLAPRGQSGARKEGSGIKNDVNNSW